MVQITADRVLETSTTTGTGAFTLAGAIAGHQRFSDVCSTSDTVYYSIWAVDGNGNPSGDWETGLGTYSAANTLTRTTPAASSNAGSAINFGAGTKHVALSVTAGQIDGFGGGGGLGTVLAVYTLSAASSQDVEDFAGGGYDVVEIHYDLLPSDNASQLQARFKLNTAYKTTGSYGFITREAAWGGTVNGVNSGGSATQLGITDSGATWGLSNTADEHIIGKMTLRRPDETSGIKYARWEHERHIAGGAFIEGKGGGTWSGTDKAAALEGVRFMVSAGTLTGAIKVVGYTFTAP